MISEIIIPDLGATGGDVALEEWLIKPGEYVESGQALYLVATDKATVEVESFRDGVLHTILVPQGEIVPIGKVVGLLADSIDEKIEIMKVKSEERSEVPMAETETFPAPHTGKRILASPIARRIAAEENISLDSITGSGPQGQILKRDVFAVLSSREISEPPMGVLLKPLSPMRRTIAERTSLSKSHIPHFYTNATIDMQAASELRQQTHKIAEQSGQAKPTITDLCILATALTLRKISDLNARFDGETLSIHEDINIGIVIGLTEGMLIPVIPRADQLNLFALAAATQKLRQRAEAGQFRSSDVGQGTFTISNLGMFEIDSFTAVINPPEVGILALGKIKEQPTVINGDLIIHPLMTAILSVDHRVIDGILAARFLTALKDILENPYRLVQENSQDDK